MKTSPVKIPLEKAPGPSGRPLELHSSGWGSRVGPVEGPAALRVVDQPSGLWMFLSYLALAPWPITLTLHKPSLHFLFLLSGAFRMQKGQAYRCVVRFSLQQEGKSVPRGQQSWLQDSLAGGGWWLFLPHRNSASVCLGGDHRFSFPADSQLMLILPVQGPYLEEQASRAVLSTCDYLNLN